VAATVGAGVMGLVRSMAWSYEAFLAFEFLDPVFASGIYTAGFVLSKILGLHSTQISQYPKHIMTGR
jgi:hypothetical protein